MSGLNQPQNAPVVPQPSSPDRASQGEANLYVPLSREHRFWLHRLGNFVAPRDGRGSLASRAFGVFAVAPFAHLTFFSLAYQAYLYDIFHQSKNARFWHFTCMPLINLMIMVALAQFSLTGTHPPEHGVVWLAPNGALIYAAVLLLWYGSWAVMERYWLWGVVMLPVVLALLVGANLIYHATFVVDASLRTWYAPTALVANPFLWMGILSFIQAASHGTEPYLPPRVTASPRWKTVGAFLSGEPGEHLTGVQRLVRLVRLVAQSIYGTIDEFWASPRLLPIGILEQMWRHGYQVERFHELDELTQRALASGEPAIDYIGSGGGAYLPLPGDDRPTRT